MFLKKFYIFFVILGFLNTNISSSPAHTLQLKYPKGIYYSLKSEWLKELVAVFNVEVFVESGTYEGGTTTSALSLFKEIHTIELSPEYWKYTTERFRGYPHVHVYLGDSSIVLPKILPTINKKILFWLDGHYSGGGTAKGTSDTAILNELNAIKKSGIKNAIILVDDIRQFQSVFDKAGHYTLTDYPLFTQLKKAMLEINPEYQVVLYGDIALAYPKEETVTVSPIIQACTISRLFGEEGSPITLQEALEAEKIISMAQEEEKATLQTLAQVFRSAEEYGYCRHFRLWNGLLLLNEKRYQEAFQQFTRALELGCNYNHIETYLALCK